MRKNEVEIIVNPSSKWISKGHPYLEECDRQVWNHKKHRFATCVREIEKNSTSTCPGRIDFDGLARMESLFPLLSICSISVKLCGQKLVKLGHMGADRSKQMELERSGKHVKNITTKMATRVTNVVQKEGLQK
jgi:hypothetical protein